MTVTRTMAIQQAIEKLSSIYAKEVLSQPTRVVILLGRKCEPQILDTFLGYELKVARRRITCPDMSTARYLKIFAEVGMPSIRTPYDPTRTIRVLPELERALKQIKELLLQENLPEKRHQSRLRGIYKRIRDNLKIMEGTISDDTQHGQAAG
ncbi:hypothetical protein MYX82_05975 [Acidobacteria bacterium AH-259-D05]|nr:hypothetical protein [Acidobacteria bacterium AH-259-D05]